MTLAEALETYLRTRDELKPLLEHVKKLERIQDPAKEVLLAHLKTAKNQSYKNIFLVVMQGHQRWDEDALRAELGDHLEDFRAVGPPRYSIKVREG